MGMNGTDVLLKVNTGTEAVPVWTTVAAQRDASISESNDTIDFSSKDNREWEGAAGRYESEVSLDGLIPVAAEPGFDALKTACRNGTLIQIQTSISGTPKEKASAIVTQMDQEYPDQGESTFSASLKITGAWTAAT
jgi:TP901-1 family phage major tail protein